MPYFRWTEGDMVGHLVAASEADARAQLTDDPAADESIPAGDDTLHIARVDGALGELDFDDADDVIVERRPAIEAARRPALELATTRVPRLSHLGGRPRLDANAEWPSNLPLLAELDFAELATDARDEALGLPQSGRLSFFFDPSGERVDGIVGQLTDRLQLIFSAGPSPSEPLDAPTVVTLRPEQGLASGLTLTLPHWDDGVARALFEDDDDALEAYVDFHSNCSSGLVHQLRGHACWLSNDPRARPDVGSGWLLLWQITGDSDWFRGRCEQSAIYLLIREADLAAKRFSECYVDMQGLYP